MMHKQPSAILESIWYIYWQDNYHGPFSELELYAWTKSKKGIDDVHFWKLGMNSWAPYKEVELLNKFNLYHEDFEQLAQTHDTPILWRNWDQVNDGKSQFLKRNEFSWIPDNLDLSHPETYLNPALKLTKAKDEVQLDFTTKESHSKLNFFNKNYVILSGLIFFTGITIWLLNSFHINWSQIPQPEGVMNEDYRELLKVIEKSEEEVGSRFALAFNKNQTQTIKIYISTNIPEKSVFTLEIKGVPSSMVGAFYFDQFIVLKNQKGLVEVPDLGKTVKLIPKGFYQLKITYNQKNVYDQVHFIGGERNKIYSDELKDYHAKLYLQFIDELEELKQINSSMEGQITQLSDLFENYIVDLQHSSKAKPKKSWTHSRSQWLEYQKQLEQLISKFKVEDRREQYLMLSYFTQLGEVGQSLIDLYQKTEQFIQLAKLDSKNELSISLELTELKRTVVSLRETILKLELKVTSEGRLPWNELD